MKEKLCWVCHEEPVSKESSQRMCDGCEKQDRKQEEEKPPPRPSDNAPSLGGWSILNTVDDLLHDIRTNRPEGFEDEYDVDEDEPHFPVRSDPLFRLPSFADAAKKSKREPVKESVRKQSNPAKAKSPESKPKPAPDQLQPGETVDHWMARLRRSR